MNKLLVIPMFRKLLTPSWRALATRDSQDTDSGKTGKKKEHENRITLIAPDDSISIMDLVSAQKLSVRRELKLVKLQDEDSKTRRPVYKLMTNAEYHEEELQKRKEKQVSRQNENKGDKLLTVSTKIAQHDLMTRIKNVTKWLERKYEVRVVISADDEQNIKSEHIYSIIESNIKNHGKIVQKRSKGNSLRFQILPDLSKHPELDEKYDNTNNNYGDVKKSSNDKGPL